MAIFSIITDIILASLLILVVVLLTARLIKRLTLWRENKRFRAIQEQIDLLYFDKNITAISIEAREQLKEKSEYDFSYGELHIVNFLYLLKQAGAKRGLLFVDLGSGAGKLVLAAKRAFDMQCFGIELIPELHDLARHALKNLHNHGYDIETDFLCGDYFDADLSQADIIYINATAFNNELWDKIVLKFKMLKPGVRIITTTKRLPEDHFKCVYQGLEYASWGWVSAFIYVKK